MRPHSTISRMNTALWPVLLGLVGFAQLSMAQEATGGPNLLLNSGFEELAAADNFAHWDQEDAGRTIFADTQVKHEGKIAARIVRREAGQSRIHQLVQCKPKTKYRLAVWSKLEQVKGRAYFEVYALPRWRVIGSGGHGIGSRDWTQHEIEFQTGPEDEQLRVYVRLQQGAGTVWFDDLSLCEVIPPPLSVTLRSAYFTPVKQRRLHFAVGPQVMKAGAREITVGYWPQGTGTPTRPPTINIEVRGQGEAVADITRLGLGRWHFRVQAWARGERPLAALEDEREIVPAILPHPQSLKLARGRLDLARGAALWLPEGAGELERVGAEMVAQYVKEKLGLDLPISRKGSLPSFSVALAASKEGPAWPRPPSELPAEGYVLRSGPEGVAIVGRDAPGAFYGCQTLCQLIQRESGRAMVPGVQIVDYPELPLRGVYSSGTKLTSELERRIRALATLKINAVLIESGAYYDLDNEDTRRQVQEVFARYRRYGIDPIPELQSFGYGGSVNSRLAQAAEGWWVRDEQLTLKDTEEAPLSFRHVIRTDATDIVLTSKDKATTYEQGRDYKVLDGTCKYPYDQDKGEPFRIVRVPEGRIKSGETVLASYDYAKVIKRFQKRRGNIPYCPSEPQTYELMGRTIRNVVKYLHPRYVHVGHDEIRQMKTDSRCLQSGKSNAELLAADIIKLHGFLKQADPQARLMLWDDMLNPYHNGETEFPDDPTTNAVTMIPKDVIPVVWWGPTRQDKTRFMEWFAGHGMSSVGSPYTGARHCLEWCQVCVQQRAKGRCLGVIDTTWSSWAGVPYSADWAWHSRGVADVKLTDYAPEEINAVLGLPAPKTD